MEQLLVLLDELIESALDKLYKQDIYLLEHEVHERTIVFRFGHYLQNLMDETEAFRDYYLDFEYNRNGNQPKRIPAQSQNGALPDLIIHQRGTNAHNLLIMEFKTPWNRQIEDDCKKLRQFIDSLFGIHNSLRFVKKYWELLPQLRFPLLQLHWSP